MPLARPIGSRRWQSDQLDLASQGIDHPQDVFKSQGGFACFEINDEAHSDPRGQRQLRLCQPELLARCSKRIAELLR